MGSVSPCYGRAVRTGVRAVAMAAFVLAACGSTARLSKAQYERQLGTIGTDAGTTLSRIFSDPALLTPRSLRQAAQIVRQGASTIDDAASKIAGLKPPADVEALNEQLAAAFRQLASELRRWAADAERGDVQAVKTFDEQLRANELPGELLIQRTIADLRSKGYVVGG